MVALDPGLPSKQSSSHTRPASSAPASGQRPDRRGDAEHTAGGWEERVNVEAGSALPAAIVADAAFGARGYRRAMETFTELGREQARRALATVAQALQRATLRA